jgi:hypothetical protein
LPRTIRPRGEDSTPSLNSALKVITTAEGPSYQKLLFLRRIQRQTEEKANDPTEAMSLDE